MFRELLGQQVNTISFGDGEDTLVAMSGAFGTWEIWQQPFELLSRRLRVIGYDHFGVGETHCPPELVTFEHQVELALALLDALEVLDCVLVGDSAMCATAVEVALRQPDRVRALVLVSGGAATEPGDETRRFVAGLNTAFAPTVDYFAGLCLPEDEAGHLRRWLADIIRRSGPQRCIRLVESFYGVDVRPVLSEIRAPTLVVHGELDSMSWSNRALAAALVAGISGAELVELPGAGHVPQLSQPVELVAAIESFLARIPARRQGATATS